MGFKCPNTSQNLKAESSTNIPRPSVEGSTEGLMRKELPHKCFISPQSEERDKENNSDKIREKNEISNRQLIPLETSFQFSPEELSVTLNEHRTVKKLKNINNNNDFFKNFPSPRSQHKLGKYVHICAAN